MQDESARRRWTRIFKPDARTEVDEELAFHIEERVRANIARGMDPEAARAAAQQRLGDLQEIRSECTDLLVAERRAEARRDWMKFSWLDFKLGFRMLAKYPGLTIVGGITIAFAIALGGVAFEYMMQVTRPALGLPASDRIVALRLWQTAPVPMVEEQALHDFLAGPIRYICPGTGALTLPGCASARCGGSIAFSCPGGRRIAICPTFWSFPLMQTVDQRGGNMIHESVHMHLGFRAHGLASLDQRGRNSECHAAIVADIYGFQSDDTNDCTPLIP